MPKITRYQPKELKNFGKTFHMLARWWRWWWWWWWLSSYLYTYDTYWFSSCITVHIPYTRMHLSEFQTNVQTSHISDANSKHNPFWYFKQPAIAAVRCSTVLLC